MPTTDVRTTISRVNDGDLVLFELAQDVSDDEIQRFRQLIQDMDSEATFLIVPFGVVQGMSNLDLHQLLKIRSDLDELIQTRLPKGVGDA
jgi:hypothetical protein